MLIKEIYSEELQTQLDELNTKINELKGKVTKTDEPFQLSTYKTLEELSLRRELIKSKLQEVENTSDTAWEELKEGLGNAWADLSASIKAVMDRLK